MLARTIRFLGGGGLLFAAAAGPLSAQIVNDGGFEAPVVTGGEMGFNTGTSFAGWQVVGAQGAVFIITNDQNGDGRPTAGRNGSI